MSKILQTEGKGHFFESDWIRPLITDDQIAVKSIMTGVCRSDIDMMQGNFGPLPIHMQGHEGLGQVIEVGKNITDVEIGNYVATRGEPAFADEYNVNIKEYVEVPTAEPKYILEPVACGINLIETVSGQIHKKSGPKSRMLILGSGFLAWVAYNTVRQYAFYYDIVVVGNSNKEIWGDILTQDYTGVFDVVIDLSNRTDIFDKDILNTQALIVLGSQKEVTTDFQKLLWKACTMVFPSPRANNFHRCMQLAELWITAGRLQVDKFWTRSYIRQTEWQDAFLDGAYRPNNYSRGYITWV